MPPEDESWTESSENAIHCECALLTELHKLSLEGQSIIGYIGVSKLPCALCHLYFECYRKITGTVITTLGTHGQFMLWGTPALSTNDDRVKEALREKLKAKLLVEARIAKTQQPSSQNVVASQASAVGAAGENTVIPLTSMFLRL